MGYAKSNQCEMHDENDKSLYEKYRLLLRKLSRLGNALVAFSGGVDSTLLLYAAKEALGSKLRAVTLAPPYVPQAEISEAKTIAVALSVSHQIVSEPFLEIIRDNPADHCYWCKRHLFGVLQLIAAQNGFDHVLEGTNTDDMQDYRPGLAALRELGIESPLLMAGLTKNDIRLLSRNFGLPGWERPANSCLLSRIPVGTRVTDSELRRIEQGESYLVEIGFPAVRLRSHGNIARIEVPFGEIPDLFVACKNNEIDLKLKDLGYEHVAIDIAGYRMGSLNEMAAQSS